MRFNKPSLQPYVPIIYIFLILLSFVSAIFADGNEKVVDTFLKNVNKFSDNTKFENLPVKEDSVILLNEIGISDTLTQEEIIFYENILRQSSNILGKELAALFFKTPEIYQSSKIEKGVQRFKIYDGKIIRSISLNEMEIFEVQPADSNKTYINMAFNLANDLHVKTHENIIWKNIIIHEGDALNPYLISENERLIRNLPYIEDAHFFIYPDAQDSHYVNIMVLTKDYWFASGDGLIKDMDDFILNAKYNNALGTGIGITGTFTKYPDRKSVYYTNTLFSVNNIGGYFIDGQYTFHSDPFTTFNEFRFNRRLQSAIFKYTGGLIMQQGAEYNLIEKDDLHYGQYRYNYNDAWAGRAFNMKFSPELNVSDKQIILSGRVNKTTLSEIPALPDSLVPVMENEYNYFASIALGSREYYRGRYIYGMGVTEDIPVGYLLESTVAYNHLSGQERSYGSLAFSKTRFDRSKGYFYRKIQFGAFLRKDQFEDAILSIDFLLFNMLRPVSIFKFRHFLKANYTAGMNITDESRLYLVDSYGIRGLNLEDRPAFKRLFFRAEGIFYSPVNYYGFRSALFVHADLGFMGNEGENIFREEYYAGIGGGIRFKNRHLIFDTMHLGVIFYPAHPQGTDDYIFQIKGVKRLAFDDFIVSKPDYIPFQ